MNEHDTPKKARLSDPVVFLATGFGLGLSPVAPGTVGTLLGVVIVLCWRYFLYPSFTWAELIFAVVLTAIAIPLCGMAEKRLGKHDDRRIVADEYMTFPICMLGLPALWWVLLVAFLTNRFFDILKPPPAYQLQDLPGGTGVVMDDVMAAVYSLMVNHAVYWFVVRLLGVG